MARSASRKPSHWSHQADELLYNWDAPGRALLWGMRTGKSRVTIEGGEMLHRAGEVAGVLIMAPNGVHSNWIRRELPAWTEEPSVKATWSSRLSHKRDTAFELEMHDLLSVNSKCLRWFAVNDEALINERLQKAINEFRKVCRDRVLMVADESTLFRRPGARRTMLARALARRLPYKRILEGTALLNSPLHAFSQFELLEKGALGFTRYEDFKAHYSVWEQRTRQGGRTYPALKEYINMEELRERIARWASVVLRQDVDDMPELLSVVRDVVLSDKQAVAYKRLVRESLLEIDGEDRTLDGANKVMKLQQIIMGYIYNGDEVISIDDQPPILDAMSRELPEDGKAIIWCRFKEDIRRVVRRLKEMGREPVQYHGDISERERERNIDLFMTDGAVTDFVGQPQAGGRGLNLSAASTVINYSALPDAIVMSQAAERATMVAGQNVSLVRLAVPGTVEEDIHNDYTGKVALADAVSGRGLRDLLLRTRV